MKKIIFSLLFIAASATALTGCSDDGNDNKNEPGSQPDAPTVVLVGGDIDAVHEITDKMSVKVQIAAPGGIKSFTINIDSPALTAEILAPMNLAAQMDLITPASDKMAASLKELGFPAGASILNSKEQAIDISTLIPMIKMIYGESSNHNFKVSITDNANQSVVKTLKFHLTGPSSVSYNDDANLWTNTATLTAIVQSEGEVKIEYKKKSETEWQTATVTQTEDNYTASIAPTWIKGAEKHPSGVDIFTLDGKTGVFANNTYTYRLTINGKEADNGEFSTTAGQKIPFGNMNTWSKYIGFNDEFAGDPTFDEYKVDYPNQSADNSFWGNGNNAFTATLCTPNLVVEGDETNSYAHLQGAAAMGVIYAAGNLFAGVFDLPQMAGYARFGEKYEFTARPTALKVRVKATITTITKINPSEGYPIPEAANIGNIDPARIFVCITDWSDRHSVYSGLGVAADQMNCFDPVADVADPVEGKVIGFGNKTFTEDVAEWTDLIIPINWKDQQAKPADNKFSLVISCASSAYGDYLCGSADNILCVDDFEWIY